MSKPKHTPGPWKCNPTPYPNGDLDVNAYNPKEKDPVYQASSLCLVIHHTGNHGDWRDRDREEVLANAHLIAASPLMLKALEAMDRARRTPMVDDDFPEMLHIADSLMAAALKAAKGEE
jgi:hypothetical protein